MKANPYIGALKKIEELEALRLEVALLLGRAGLIGPDSLPTATELVAILKKQRGA